MYSEHFQPKEPYGDYYYDLSLPSARAWQANVAKHYGIYGFCYYHYWFSGKRLLEKPFNEVLKLGEPDLPFCLSWANEPWTRRWDGGDHHVLMPQNYGNETEWEQHFNDLLPAFLDPRYIRVEDKPLFIIYRPGIIPRCEEMLSFWNRLARQNGLAGVYTVRTLGGFPIPRQEGFDASLEFEPHYTFANHFADKFWTYIEMEKQKHLVIDYDQVWLSILNRSHRRAGEKIYPGAFVNWDNTPRIGPRGQSCLGASPGKFAHYLTRQLERANRLFDSEFVFINAWNEWAEGAYLEPDKQYGYQYLDAVKQALKASGSKRVTVSGSPG